MLSLLFVVSGVLIGGGPGPPPGYAYGVGADPPALEKFLLFWQK